MTSTLRLGFDPEFAPLTWSDTGRPAGRAIEIVCAAVGRAGITLQLIAVGLGAPGAVAPLRLDGFARMAVTPGRTDYSFSVPYLTTASAFFFAVRQGRRDGPAEPDETVGGEAGIAVATPRAGPLFALLSQGVAAERPAPDELPVRVARVVPGADYPDCLVRVLRGEVDAAALNAEVGRTLVARQFPGAFDEHPTQLPDLSLAVALTGNPAEARLMLSRLDPALESVNREILQTRDALRP